MGFLDNAGLTRLWAKIKALVGIPTKRALTQAEYEALSEEEKAADVLYLITDGNGGGGSVTSFNGRAGDVTPEAGDYSAEQIAGLPEALAAKQDKLTGAAGQVVGFDESGKAVAQKAPSGGMTQAEADARYIQPGGSYPGASYTQLGSFAFGDDGVISLIGQPNYSDLYFESVKTKTKIGNLAAPSDPDDAATKEYVDGRTAGATIKVEKVLIPKNTEAGTVIKSSVLYRTNSGDNIEPVVAIPQAGQEDWFEDGKITWKIIVQYSFVDDSYSYVVEVTVNTPPTYDAQLNVFYVEPGF